MITERHNPTAFGIWLMDNCMRGDLMKQLGFINDKRIPEACFGFSKEWKEGLLWGIFYTSTVIKGKKSRLLIDIERLLIDLDKEYKKEENRVDNSIIVKIEYEIQT